MQTRRTPLGRLLLALLLLMPAGAYAFESNWLESDSGKARVRLIAAGSASDAAYVRAGIEIRLDRGWHTYWRYAGDAGLPPQFDWAGSVNLDQAVIRWPAPARIRLEDGLESIGYKDSVLLPVYLYPKDPARPIQLRLQMRYGVCEQICIPAAANLSARILPESGRSHAALDRAEARVPEQAAPEKTGAFGISSVWLERGAKPAAIVEVNAPNGQPIDLFAEGPSDDWAPPLPKRKDGNGRIRFVVPLDGAGTGSVPFPKALRLTLVAGDRAIETLAPLD